MRLARRYAYVVAPAAALIMVGIVIGYLAGHTWPKPVVNACVVRTAEKGTFLVVERCSVVKP